MIELVIDSIKVSLVSQYRVIILKERNGERFLPIWIGPYEAEAITMQLQGTEVPRPMTHDLLKKTILAMGGDVQHVLVSELKQDTFYASVIINANGKRIEVDSRTSDAIALAVRMGVKIYAAEEILDEAGIVPEEDISGKVTAEEAEKLSAFSDFIDTLDLDDLGKKEN